MRFGSNIFRLKIKLSSKYKPAKLQFNYTRNSEYSVLMKPSNAWVILLMQKKSYLRDCKTKILRKVCKGQEFIFRCGLPLDLVKGKKHSLEG